MATDYLKLATINTAKRIVILVKHDNGLRICDVNDDEKYFND